MVKESVRKCSHCGHNGHNSRTCNGKGCFKLFGVRIATEKEDESIRKSKSLGNLLMCNAGEQSSVVDAGYLSDGLIQSKKAKAAHERKKGVPWTENEHRSFLVGLEKLGRGDWRGISRNFVPTRTPTQVASHAQKYFIRMDATKKTKLRSSLFDMPFKKSVIFQAPPQPPQNSPVSPSNAETSHQDSNSHLKNISEIQAQASTSAQVANPLEDPQVLPMAPNYGVPDFRPVPYMVGVPGSGHQSFPAPKVFPAVSFVPVMNFPNQGYVCLPRSHGNFTTCGPFMSSLLPQPLPLPLSLPLPHGPSQAAPGTSVTKKDDQALSIGVI
uniref:Putative transcription factor MYB1R1-like isoform X1 n=1 Tax=Davidia involucrata TaxID=16924 RepID=A0A5B6YMD0_DAVIN